MDNRMYRQLCCYAGCKQEYLMDLYDVSDEALNAQFMSFQIYKCEGQVYCTEDCHCPRHNYECPHDLVFDGSLCSDHFELFRGEDYGDYYSNIAKADPELFDKRRADGCAAEGRR